MDSVPAFDPRAIDADAYAVLVDTAPAEFWYDFAEATSLVRRVILVKDFLGCNLITAKHAAEKVIAAQGVNIGFNTRFTF